MGEGGSLARSSEHCTSMPGTQPTEKGCSRSPLISTTRSERAVAAATATTTAVAQDPHPALSVVVAEVAAMGPPARRHPHDTPTPTPQQERKQLHKEVASLRERVLVFRVREAMTQPPFLPLSHRATLPPFLPLSHRATFTPRHLPGCPGCPLAPCRLSWLPACSMSALLLPVARYVLTEHASFLLSENPGRKQKRKGMPLAPPEIVAAFDATGFHFGRVAPREMLLYYRDPDVCWVERPMRASVSACPILSDHSVLPPPSALQHGWGYCRGWWW